MMAQPELVLKPNCSNCGATSDLYASKCRHMTLCPGCGKHFMENSTPCSDCGGQIAGLVREFNVKSHALNKTHFVGRFLQGLPSFSKKKNADQNWNMQREGLQGRQITDTLREKFKGKPWLLEDDQKQQSYQGTLEGGQQAAYYLLMMHGKDFLAMPAGAWYNFHKVANYKQLTLEEAEEQMKNRRRQADGYQRWLMKGSVTGAAAFAEAEKVSGGGSGGGGRGGFRRSADDDEEPASSDKGEEDPDDDEERKNRLGLNKKGGDDDEEEPAKTYDEMEEEEPEKGDDWEHEETFTDDDEAVAIDPEERDDQAPELPAPPEIKQEDDDEEREQEDGQQEKGGLSESGLELKKLLGKSAGLEDSDDESSDEDGDLENEDSSSPVLAPKKKDTPKEEPQETTPVKPTSTSAGRTTPTTGTGSKGKRKSTTDDPKPAASSASKKVKAEPAQEDVKPVKKEPATSSSTTSSKGSSNSPAKGGSQSKSTSPVTEEDVKAVLKQSGPIKSHDLVNRFRSRLVTSDDKAAFAAVLKNISRIHKTNAGNFIVLREK